MNHSLRINLIAISHTILAAFCFPLQFVAAIVGFTVQQLINGFRSGQEWSRKMWTWEPPDEVDADLISDTRRS